MRAILLRHEYVNVSTLNRWLKELPPTANGVALQGTTLLASSGDSGNQDIQDVSRDSGEATLLILRPACTMPKLDFSEPRDEGFVER
jgi:hypothetical protein